MITNCDHKETYTYQPEIEKPPEGSFSQADKTIT
jgi:hypothetical protein